MSEHVAGKEFALPARPSPNCQQLPHCRRPLRSKLNLWNKDLGGKGGSLDHVVDNGRQSAAVQSR